MYMTQTAYSPVSSFTDLPRVFGSVAAGGLDCGNGMAPSGMLPYAFLLHTRQIQYYHSFATIITYKLLPETSHSFKLTKMLQTFPRIYLATNTVVIILQSKPDKTQEQTFMAYVTRMMTMQTSAKCNAQWTI